MSKLKRFKIGERIRRFPIRSWNGLVDHAEKSAVEPQLIPTPGSPGRLSNTCIIQLKNVSGAWRDQGSVLGLDTLAVDANLVPECLYDTPVINGVAPVLATHSQKHAVLLQSLPVDEIGPAAVANAIWAEVNVTDAAHWFVEIDPANYRYKSATGGLLILAKPTGTGVKKCVVSIGGAGTGDGSVLVRGTCNSEWDAAPPLDVVFAYATGGGSEFDTDPGLEWNNNHKHLFEVGADVVGWARKDGGVWTALIISAEEELATCSDEAGTVIDGGDMDRIYPYNARQPAIEYPYWEA